MADKASDGLQNWEKEKAKFQYAISNFDSIMGSFLYLSNQKYANVTQKEKQDQSRLINQAMENFMAYSRGDDNDRQYL